jgi:hypothetical protein
MGVADDMRAERKARRGYDPDDPFDQEAAKRDFSRDRHRRAKQEGQSHREAYQEGVKEGRQRSRPKGAKRPPARRPLRSQARRVAAPAAQQVTSGMHFVILSLLVAALYLVLTTEAETDALSGFLGGLSKAVRWLADPSKSIPAKKG